MAISPIVQVVVFNKATAKPLGIFNVPRTDLPFGVTFPFMGPTGLTSLTLNFELLQFPDDRRARAWIGFIDGTGYDEMRLQRAIMKRYTVPHVVTGLAAEPPSPEPDGWYAAYRWKIDRKRLVRSSAHSLWYSGMPKLQAIRCAIKMHPKKKER